MSDKLYFDLEAFQDSFHAIDNIIFLLHGDAKVHSKSCCKIINLKLYT